MRLGQYKRIYNILFAASFVLTITFGYKTSKDFISDWISSANEGLRAADADFARRPSYAELIGQGKVKEAEEGDRMAKHYHAVQKRIWFCEDHLESLSVVLILLVYVLSYFLIWYFGCFCVRYVSKG